MTITLMMPIAPDILESGVAGSCWLGASFGSGPFFSTCVTVRRPDLSTRPAAFDYLSKVDFRVAMSALDVAF